MIRKAVIAAAGFGTRFLPFAKSAPKEMLPIVDTPAIQYVVEEAAAAGITDLLIVISRGKRAIEEHFDRNLELEAVLQKSGRVMELKALRQISEWAKIHFVWQKELNGLGDAVAQAREHVGREPFLLLLGDTVIRSRLPLLARLIELHDQYQASIVALETVEPSKVDRYGIIAGRKVAGDVYRIEGFVEKPEPSAAPSNLAIAARYAFTPDIFDYLARTPPAKNGELQLTDAMCLMLKDRPLYGTTFEGRRFDLGCKLDFLKTNVEFGLAHAELGEEFRSFIQLIARGL